MIGDRKTKNALTTIKDTSNNIKDMKSTQYVGKRSFITYVTSSSNINDFSIVNMVPSYAPAKMVFTYVSSASTKHHMLKPTVYYRLDNPDVMASPTIVNPNTDAFLVNIFQDESQSGQCSWIIQVSNFGPSTRTIYLKAFFFGTVSGTFTITAL